MADLNNRYPLVRAWLLIFGICTLCLATACKRSKPSDKTRPSSSSKPSPDPGPASSAGKAGASAEDLKEVTRELPGSGKSFKFTAEPVRMMVPTASSPLPSPLKDAPFEEDADPDKLLKIFRDYRAAHSKDEYLEPTMLDVLSFNGPLHDLAKKGGLDILTMHEAILPYLPSMAGKRVVEMAAGYGKMMGFWVLNAKVDRVILVDVDPVCIDLLAYLAARDVSITKEARGRITLLQDRVNDPCLPVSWADLIYVEDMHAWIFWDDQEDPDHRKGKRFWTSVIKGLAPGGHLVIVDNCPEKKGACSSEAGLLANTNLSLISSLPGIKRMVIKNNIPNDHHWFSVFQKVSTPAVAE